MIKLGMALVAAVLLARAAPPDQEIRAVLDAQVSAWNRGDIDRFATGYEKSPGLVFVGKDIARGYDRMVARYKKTYSTSAQMGKLDFRDLEIHVLSPEWANVLGHFHLERDGASGGNADGVFTLLFHHSAAGWKIVQDHTS